MAWRFWSGATGTEQIVTGQSLDSSADTAASVVLPGMDGKITEVQKVIWSYDGDPTGGALTIADGATTIRKIDITAGGPGALNFSSCRAARGNSITVTLAAGGSGVSGQLMVEAVRLEN